MSPLDSKPNPEPTAGTNPNINIAPAQPKADLLDSLTSPLKINKPSADEKATPSSKKGSQKDVAANRAMDIKSKLSMAIKNKFSTKKVTSDDISSNTNSKDKNLQTPAGSSKKLNIKGSEKSDNGKTLSKQKSMVKETLKLATKTGDRK